MNNCAMEAVSKCSNGVEYVASVLKSCHVNKYSKIITHISTNNVNTKKKIKVIKAKDFLAFTNKDVL